MTDKEKKTDGGIMVPTLKIDELTAPVINKIIDMTSTVGELSILNPLALIKHISLNKEKREARKEYNSVLQKCYDLLKLPVSGPGFVMAQMQSWSTAKGFSAIFEIQDVWREFDSIYDRKLAYFIAIISLYITTLSLGFGIWSIL